MNLSELLIHVRSLGIELRVSQDRLVCDAPRGALTPELSAALKDNKEEIISFLRQAHHVPPTVLPRITHQARPADIPLSFAQQRMWFLEKMDPDTCVHNLPAAYKIAGRLDAAALRQSLQTIVNRHASLRTTFAWKHDYPEQVIAPELTVSLPVVDLSALEADAQRRELLRVLRTASQHVFDLERGPLFQCMLIRMRETEHIIFFMPHHIIFDGWSFDMFLYELEHHYEALTGGKPPSLPEPPVQYHDYAVWQRSWLDGGELQRQLVYWKKKLSGELPVLHLPMDRPRPPVMSYGGARESVTFSRRFVDSLKKLGNMDNATLYMVLLAAFKAVLFRYTGQQDILIGFPIQNRIRPEIEQLIGYFVNTLVLRTSVKPDWSFRALLCQVRKNCLEAYSHQDMPFDRLIEELQPKRDQSVTPVYQVLFSYQDARERRTTFAGLSISQVHVEPFACPTDMIVWFMESPESLLAGIDYNTDIFDSATIQRVLGSFSTVLHSICAYPDMLISRLPLLSGDEQRQILVGFNATAAPYPATACLQHLFEARVEQTPDAPAVLFRDQRITYRELNERANRLAHFLARAGVGPDMLVGLCLERSIEMVIGLLAILKAGGAYLPLDPLFPRDRLSFMLQDSGARVLLTQQSLRDLLSVSADTQVVCVDADGQELSRESAGNPAGKSGPDQLAYVLYTSGSTGLPKGVEITHRALVNFLCSMQREPGITPDDALLAVTTLSFDIAGLELYLPLVSGARVVLAPRETAADGKQLAALLEQSGATIMQATPITWRMLLEAGWIGNKNLKILCGGEAFPADLAGPLLERSAQVWNMYGPTETTIWSTVHRIRSKNDPVLIGRPIANTQVYILDEHMAPVPPGVAGELYIGGDGLARGYLNRPELTAERFVTHTFSDNQQVRIYRTGDIARYRHDGAIECLGRTDFQIKIRGYRIEPGEIEAVLQKHPAVRSAVVDARETGLGEKRLVAYIVNDAHGQPSAQDLREFARTALPDYMVPAAYVFVDRFPLTANGKIDRKALPAPDTASQAGAEAAYAPPRTEIETTLASLWQSLLQVRRVGLHDNFFDLGGHSLLAVKLFARIEMIFDRQLPLATLLEAPTLKELAAIIASKHWKPSWASVVPIQPGGSKPLFFCVHGAGGNVLLYRDLARHLGPDQPFYGLQAKGLDGQSPLNTTIEDMARDYIKEIRELQPEGPYYVGGYCLGGAIAYEMARQLAQQGQTVAVVAMLDTQREWITDIKPHIVLYQGYQKIAFHMGNFIRADLKGKRDFLNEKTREAGRRIKKRYDIVVSKLLYAMGWRVEKPLVLMETINDRASIYYKPEPYPGRVALFKPCRAYAGYDDPLYGWGDGLTAGVDVYELSSYPAGMLVEPFVAELAAKLSDCLEKARLAQSAAD